MTNHSRRGDKCSKRLGQQLLVLLGAAASLLGSCPANAADLIFPAALRPGDKIALVAPARPVTRKRMQLVKQRLEALGFQVRMPDELFRNDGYLAGSDQHRAAEVMAAFKDKSVAAVFPATGGFGTTRMLDLLDYDTIRDNPKVVIGFSDITGLHLAIHKKSQLVTFHSPNPDGGFGSPNNLPPFAAHWFYRALLADRYREKNLGYLITPQIPSEQEQPTTQPVTVTPGIGRGRLIGGNLSLISALMGTPYEIETDGRILFIEDIGEAPYRVDRMLSTLRLAGKLDHLAGVVLGMFTRRANEDTSGERGTTDDVLRGYFSGLGVPVILHFPVGHHPRNATLPIGAMCELNASQGTIRLLENPVQLRSSP